MPIGKHAEAQDGGFCMNAFPFVSVIVDVPLLPPLTYKVAYGTTPRVGDRCVVPLGHREVVGLVVELLDQTDLAPDKQKTYVRLLNETEPLGEEWLRLTKFAADYYQHSWGEVSLGALPVFFRQKPKPRYEMSLSRLRRSNLTKASKSPQLPIIPNAEQEQAIRAINLAEGFSPFVLHGVTGSGKTEVYLQVIAQTFAKNPEAQILFLVPEINLTPQLEKRVRERFPDNVVVSMHSGLSAMERARSWLAMHEKRAQILIGTRMATFSSIPNLSLIIIDEEHDLSYKAGDGIRYSGRDLCIKRAQLKKVPIVLGSATPSLETWAKVRAGQYQLLSLRHRAVQSAHMPKLTVINPRESRLVHGLAQPVIDQVTQTLERHEQIIFFLNRRGYAPVVSCPSCGWLSRCPHCSTYAVYHKNNRRLMCHHCGWSTPVYSHCPECGNVDLQPLGAGTQRIEETLHDLWPQARILRIDRDSTQQKEAAQKAFQAVHEGQVDILVGTQMVAKGHDFQNVSLVVVLNIDAKLVSANPRSEERAFANLMQVAGRAGRSGLKAEMIVQSRFGDRPIFAALAKQDYEMFADRLLRERRAESAVPFVFQALLMADDASLDKALEFLTRAAAIGGQLCGAYGLDGITIFDPIPMAVVKVADKERAQLLVESASRVNLNRFLRLWYDALVRSKKSVHWVMDVDPMDV